MSQNRAGEAWYDLGGRDAGLRAALDKAEADIKRSGAVAEAGFAASMSKIGGGLTDIGGGLQKTGRSMLTNLTLPLLAAGGAATHFALDFDSTMRRVVGLTDITADQIGKIKQDILDLAPAVGKGPQELAEAFYFVASAGFKASEAMDVLEVAAKTSTAGLGTTQTIAQVLGGVLNAYGHANITAARAADILTEAVSQGTAEADGFANVIGLVVPGAAALGVSFDQVSAALAGMTLSGIGAEEAATSIGQIMNSLLKPTSEAEEALHNMGLSSAGLRQELREKGLLDTLKTLDSAFAGNAASTALVFGNIRALRGVNALLGLDEQQLADVFDKVSKSVGRSGEAFDTFAEGPQFRMNQALADLQVSAIQLGEDALPLVAKVLEQVAASVRALARWWGTLDQGLRDNIIQWLAWVAIAGPVLVITGKLVSALGSLFNAVSFLVGPKGLPAFVKMLRGLSLVQLGTLGVALAALILLSDKLKARFDDADLGGMWAQMAKDSKFSINVIAEATSKLATRMGVSIEDAQAALLNFTLTTGTDLDDWIEDVRDGGDKAAAAFALVALSAKKGMTDTQTAIREGGGQAAAAAGDIPVEVAAELKDGAFVVGPAAKKGITTPVDEALQKAVADAGKRGQEIIDALAKELADGPQDLKDELKALREALINPYTDVEREADLQSSLANKAIAANLKTGDSQAEALAAQQVEDWLSQYKLLEPGAFNAAFKVNPAFQKGVTSNLDATVQWMQDNVTGPIADKFDLADVLDAMGYDGLAAYVRGMERARIAKLTNEIANTVNQVKHDLGYVGDIYYAGRLITSEWMRGLLAGIQQNKYLLSIAMWDIRNHFGHSLPTVGPLAGDATKRGGTSIGSSWAGYIASSIRASIPEVRADVARLNAALAGGSAALGALSGGGLVPAVATAAAAGPQTQIVNHYYQLTSEGKIVTGTAEDEVDALRRLAMLRQG